MSQTKPKVSVIVPAAGAGTRFGAAENKIFQPLGGEPIFLRSLRLFAGRDDVIQILLVSSADDAAILRERFAEPLDRLGVSLAVGGATRPESVRNALAQVAAEAELVCVHDAVRPCVPPELVDAVLAEAARCGAAILACPVHGTLKRVGSGGAIVETVPRRELWQAQTPQVFRRELLERAYRGDVEGATDDAQLVEALGEAVRVVPGDPRNVKITTPRDLVLAEAVLHTLPRPHVGRAT